MYLFRRAPLTPRAHDGRILSGLVFVILLCGGRCVSADPASSFHLAPAEPVASYVRQQWGSDQGLPVNTVTALAQTKDRYLWVATIEGLARFDGIKFTVFDKKTHPEIPSNNFSTLLPARDGSLWAGTFDSGLLHLEDGKITLYNLKNGLSSNNVSALYEDAQGVIWIGTDGGGLNRWLRGKIRTFGEVNGVAHAAISAIAGNPQGELWLGTRQGLKRWDAQQQQALPVPLPRGAQDIRSLIWSSRQRSLWIGTYQKGAFQWAAGSAVPVGIGNQSILSMSEDEAGGVWTGSFGQITHHDRGKEFTYQLQGAALGVSALLQTKEGGLWAGTIGGGLHRFKSTFLSMWGKQEGLLSDTVIPVFEDAHRVIWVGTDKGLNRIEKGHVSTFRLPGAGRSPAKRGMAAGVFSIAPKGPDQLWIGTLRGLYVWSKGSFTKSPLTSQPVLCMFVDQAGGLWFGTREGLTHVS
ncbi:MAG: hypothetical protein M3Y27_08330, partial [Acidobacteriota bacterium]|nr:hypothetical protein [Acidobacteriota bacterium]